MFAVAGASTSTLLRSSGALTLAGGEALPQGVQEQARALALAGVRCNEGELRRAGEAWQHAGDAVDVAFLALGYKAGLDVLWLRRGAEILSSIPFESERQYAASAYCSPDDDALKLDLADGVTWKFAACSTRAPEFT